MVVAVVGISGVGKTTLVRELADRIPIKHLQASALIKAEQARLGLSACTSEELRVGPVIDNQSLLVSGFRNALTVSDGAVVFDGHVMIDAGDRIIEVPDSVFADLGCDHIVVITEDPEIIARRRARDVARQRPVRSVSQISSQQHLSVEIAKRIAQSLGIPCTVIRSADPRTLEQLIRPEN